MVEINKIIIPGDGAVINVTSEAAAEEIEQLVDALRALWPDRKFILVRGNHLELLDEKLMNEHGWFRRNEQ